MTQNDFSEASQADDVLCLAPRAVGYLVKDFG